MKLKKIPNNIAVLTQTEFEAEELFIILHENGYKWSDGDSLIKRTMWDIYQDETCYDITAKKKINYSDRSYYQNNNYTIIGFKIFKEWYCEQEKPQPNVKVGDIVRVINDCGCNACGLIGIVSSVATRSVDVTCDDIELSCLYEWIEPYTDPETKPTEDMEENKEINKELNLCELLKGHEGEKFYSPMFGERELIEIGDRDYPISFGEDEFYDFGIDGCWSDGGVPLLFPSRTLYEQYPLDTKKAWIKWKEEQKKPFICIHWGEVDCNGDEEDDYTGNFYFRTAADRDMCIEEIKAIIKKYSKK